MEKCRDKQGVHVLGDKPARIRYNASWEIVWHRFPHPETSNLHLIMPRNIAIQCPSTRNSNVSQL